MKNIILLIFSVFILFSCGEYSDNKVSIDDNIVINNVNYSNEGNDNIVDIKKSSNNDIIEVNEKNINKNDYIENYLGIEYLLFENGSLYCIFGDENEPNPIVGYSYSKEKIDSINNPISLKVIDYTYFSDNDFIYSHENICTTGIPGNCYCSFVKENYDVKTFEKLDYYYYKDKNGIYNVGFKVEGVDIETFEVVDGDWYDARDKNNFYLEGEIITNIDK